MKDKIIATGTTKEGLIKVIEAFFFCKWIQIHGEDIYNKHGIIKGFRYELKNKSHRILQIYKP